MSGILERTMIIGKAKLSGKRERFVPFPWELVGSGNVSGWEPAEWNPMGRVIDTNRLSRGAGFDVLVSSICMLDIGSPFFYDSHGTILHGGFVQTV